MSCQNRTRCPSIKVSWLFDELSDNNASDDGLSLSTSVAVNKQISEVILMLGNDGTLIIVHCITYHVMAHSTISIRV